MTRKWIFVVTALVATSAAALPELQTGTEEDLQRFNVGFEAIKAKTYREKILTCAAPEWADKQFIQSCIHSAVNDCAFSPEPGEPAPCVNGQDLKTH